jgi:rfaE bifunctional protein nucleotidyltransferase chain/domain
MPTAQKIMSPEAALAQRKTWKENGEKLVFTNGCFDLLHLGHVDYLERAAALGQRLLIGLNTDASVSRLKGPARPLNDEYARARVLAALGFVDAVVLFGEETPRELIALLLPDVLVKGADYKVEDIAGAKEVLAAGGEVQTLTFVEGYSTTGIIQKACG